jgi:hypothetical protein
MQLNNFEKLMTGFDAAGPALSEGLRYAILFVNKLLPLLNEHPINIGGFCSEKDSGLFLKNENSSSYLKIRSQPYTGCIMIYIGEMKDFEFPSRTVVSDIEPICFEEAEMTEYLQMAAEHLLSNAD